MEALSKKFTTVQEYFSSLPANTRAKLQELRNTIKKTSPEAEEVISYNIPAFKLNGMLVWYAAFKEHIGFYPRASGIEAFKKELTKYKSARGSVQFPLDEPLPLALVTRIVRFRMKENLEEQEAKRSKKNKTQKGTDSGKLSPGIFEALSAPARRGLENAGIRDANKLAGYTEKEILQLHGIGKSSLPILRKALGKSGLSFRKVPA